MTEPRKKRIETQIESLRDIVDVVGNIYSDELDDPQGSDQTTDSLDDAERYLNKAIESLEYAQG